MAKIELTSKQQSVVDAADCSLLVAAAAGSGKTAVLVQRIIAKVLDEEHPQDIDRLLIVTFTNAAAAEMRERIGTAIEEELSRNPNSIHLQRQMMLLHNTQITTIHSFCLSVIREHFHLLLLDPGFRIGDETELSLLAEDVLEELLEEYYSKADTDFLAFVESYGSVKSDKTICDYIKKLYHFAESHPWQEEWLATLLQSFQKTHESSAFDGVMQFVQNSLKDGMILVKKMISLTEESDGPCLYRDAFLNDFDLIETLICKAKQGYEPFAQAIAEISFVRLPSKKQECREDKKEQAKALRATLKDILAKIQKDYFFAPMEELSQELLEVSEPMQALVRITLDFMRRFQEKKREKNLLDFSDLEHLALRVLVYQEEGTLMQTEAAKELAKRYDEIMIDEYQDSNLIQEYILWSVSGEADHKPNQFMVGDVKQSIYRFRMARPELFMGKYKTYQATGSHRKIALSKNFRSRAAVLSSINVLFANLMHEESAEIEYNEDAALYYGAGSAYPADTKDNCTELLFVKASVEQAVQENQEDNLQTQDRPEQESQAEESNPDSMDRTAICIEALAVAQRIRELCTGTMQVKGKEGMRPVNYSDIVILLRTMSGWSETFLEVLSEQGIPAYADTQSGYFKAVEVQKVLNFLRILDNPKQDIPFAAVLHSPMAGLSAQDLAEIRIQHGVYGEEGKQQRSLYEAARMAAEGMDTELTYKLQSFFRLYDRLHKETEYVSVHELIEHLFSYSGYCDIVSVMPGGERRRGNLSMLITKAKQYEATSFSGLYDFVRYMDKLMKYEVDFGEAKTAESGNMVRIMSIHKSKGLEFPIVFVSGMDKKFNRMDMRERLIFHPELGIGADYVDRQLRMKSPTILKKIIIKKLSCEMISEELRILYVALTRAKEKLILTGFLKSPTQRYATWKQKAGTVSENGLLSTFLQNADSYYDFICPLLFRTVKEIESTGTVISVKSKAGTWETESEFYLRELTEEDISQELLEHEWETQERLDVWNAMIESEPSEKEKAKTLSNLLKKADEFQYPFTTEATLPMKVSVSEMKRRTLMEAEEEPELLDEIKRTCQMTESQEKKSQEELLYPAYLQPEKQLSGSDKGTIYHRMMELLPFELEYTQEKLEEVLTSFLTSGRMSEQERNVISKDKILKFFQSSLGLRMQEAAKNGVLYKEQPFVIGIPAKELFPETDSTEPILMQGIIDAFFVEQGAVILMDYKTDFVKSNAKEELTKKYRPQLEYYRRALEQLYGLPVKEMWFYSFSKDCDFEV